jgi:hypothetical protein
VTEYLEPFRSIAEKSQTVFLTKDSDGKMANPKARVVVAKKNGNVKVIRLGDKGATKRIERTDKGKARDWLDQTKAVEDFVKGRWNGGDPATRQEVYDMLSIRDDICNTKNTGVST